MIYRGHTYRWIQINFAFLLFSIDYPQREIALGALIAWIGTFRNEKLAEIDRRVISSFL